VAQLSRRHFGLASAGILSAGAAHAQTPPRPSKTFVLVHGAWHGGWCWKLVRDILTAQGHHVFTPTLTGLGERSHLLSRDITLKTHIEDVINVFAFEDLKEVCLVGHSYGGWPVSGAIEKVLPHLSSIVYLDAFMPESGQKVLDYQTPQATADFNAAWERGEVSRSVPKAAFFQVKAERQAWVDAKMTPQPLGVSFMPLELTGARDKVAKRTYIRAASFKQPHFDAGLKKAKDAGWKTYELNVGHDVMVDAPEQLAEILIENS